MDNSEDKKYDVAISLRWTDIEHARKLYELLRDRLDVFLADEKQEDFVGTDGEESFGYIFRDQTRIVVVFYRQDWGETPFTRAEESAIKQRAWKEGYEFSIWVPMDEEKTIPPYLSPQYVWFDFEEYGISGLASVIEERVRESGQKVREETTTDRLHRIKRRIELVEKRQKFKSSQDGVNFISQAGQKLEEVISSQLKKYKEVNSNIPFKLERQRDQFSVTSWPYRCIFFLNKYATNSIRKAYLITDLKKHSPQNNTYSQNFKSVKRLEFNPTLNDNGNPSWRLKKGQYFSLKDVVAHALDDMAEKVYLAVEKRKSEG